MVAHNGGDFLPRTLAALAGQTRPTDAAIGVDTGSRDHSAVLLEQALGPTHVITVDEPKTGFGGAVLAGLTALSPWSERSDGKPGTDWIWLLHDDSAPAPEALAELLHAVERAPSVTVAGCKQLEWDAERRLIDVGLSISRWAERLTLIDADELDQGQYNGRTDTFAVNSAGMLIRRDVWEKLGGFDPALPGIGDDVDFCWRNRLAGHRVVIVPNARMFHVAHRPRALGNATAARKAQVHLRLKHAAGWAVPLHAIGALLGSLFKLVLSLALKDPGYGFSQLLATIGALGRPAAVARGRRNAARTRRIRRSVIKGLQTSRRDVWSHRRSLMEALRAYDADGAPAVMPLTEEPNGDAGDDFAVLPGPARGWAGNGALLAVILASAASLLGLLGLIRAEAAAGGALIPASRELADIWNHASGWWIGLGAGVPGHGDPFAYILWVLGVLGAGDANRSIVWLLLLAMPLSALGAWFAAGALTGRRRLRLAAALVWAGAPVLQVALNQGRLGALVVHVMIPLAALALLRATGSAARPGVSTVWNTARSDGGSTAAPAPRARPGTNGTPSWTAAAAAGLALGVITASAPSLLVPALAVVAVAGLVLGRRGRTVWWAMLPSIALFAPFAFSALDRPRSLLADPGLPLGFDAAPLWQQLLGQPLLLDSGEGLAGVAVPGWFGTAIPTSWGLLFALLTGLPVLLLAVAALFVPGRQAAGRTSGKAQFLWIVVLLMLAGGWLAGRVATGVSADVQVAPFTGPAVSAAAFALLGAALLAAERLLDGTGPAALRSRALSITVRSNAAMALSLLLLGPLAGFSIWTIQNILPPTGPAAGAEAFGVGTPRLIHAATPRTLPATAVDRGEGPEQTRTLLISGDDGGTFTASLMRGAGTTLDSLSAVAAARSITGEPGQESIRQDDPVDASLRNVVATLVAGDGVDPRTDLERLGVGFIVLSDSDSGAGLTAGRMDAVPGLVAVGHTDAGWLWRISPLNQPVIEAADVAHRVRIVDATGATIGLLPSGTVDADGTVPAGSDGRLVVLAERADPNWKATLNGRELSSTASGWAQAFTLPADGGRLSIRYDAPWALWAAAGQAVLIGMTVLLAIPLPSRLPHTGISRGEAALRKERQHV